ncbi:MAG TPA: zinc ribbon domain-containing protein [Thermodesulfobacteriota bacterium]|nr:zinc ribbon domain-containing protein [Thermodesulfobacteriota bacterium]
MKPQGSFCQSCAMPMDKPEIFGTNANGTKAEDYCTYCFQKGKFTEPNITMQKMIDKCVEIIVQRNIMPERQARDLMMNTIPNLKRWKKQ